MISCKVVTIRRYRESDLEGAAKVERSLFAKFTKPYATPEGAVYWSRHISLAKSNREKLNKRYSREPISFVALDHGDVVGVVTGTPDELNRLFVKQSYHRMGIGQKLLRRYERECLQQGVGCYRIKALPLAVSFYTRMGCKKTTGMRISRGLKVQSMKKVLP